MHVADGLLVGVVGQGAWRDALIQIVATYTGVTFDAIVFIDAPDALCVTSRAEVEETDAGAVVTGIDPMLEVALAPSSDIRMRRPPGLPAVTIDKPSAALSPQLSVSISLA